MVTSLSSRAAKQRYSYSHHPNFSSFKVSIKLGDCGKIDQAHDLPQAKELARGAKPIR
jgi:hypothetical protein